MTNSENSAGLCSLFSSLRDRAMVCATYCMPKPPFVAFTALAEMLIRSAELALILRSKSEGICTITSTTPCSKASMARGYSDVVCRSDRRSDASMCHAMRRDVVERSRSTIATLTFLTSIVMISGINSITKIGNAMMSRGRNELRRICRNSFWSSTINVCIGLFKFVVKLFEWYSEYGDSHAEKNGTIFPYSREWKTLNHHFANCIDVPSRRNDVGYNLKECRKIFYREEHAW